MRSLKANHGKLGLPLHAESVIVVVGPRGPSDGSRNGNQGKHVVLTPLQQSVPPYVARLFEENTRSISTEDSFLSQGPSGNAGVGRLWAGKRLGP